MKLFFPDVLGGDFMPFNSARISTNMLGEKEGDKCQLDYIGEFYKQNCCL